MYNDRWILKSEILVNLRDIGGYECNYGTVSYNKLLRSEQPVNLTEEDKEELINRGLTNIVDLRNIYEKERYINSFLDEEMVEVYEKDLKKDFSDKNPDYTAKFKDYNSMGEHYVDKIKDFGEGYADIIRYITKNKGITLVHCLAGKDRTGIVIALILMLLGVSNKDIIDDYKATDSYMRNRIEEFLKAYPGTPSYTASADPENMKMMILYIMKEYGTCFNYLNQFGYSKEDLIKLQKEFIN